MGDDRTWGIVDRPTELKSDSTNYLQCWRRSILSLLNDENYRVGEKRGKPSSIQYRLESIGIVALSSHTDTAEQRTGRGPSATGRSS
jgi:hypothetical protein